MLNKKSNFYVLIKYKKLIFGVTPISTRMYIETPYHPPYILLITWDVPYIIILYYITIQFFFFLTQE